MRNAHSPTKAGASCGVCSTRAKKPKVEPSLILSSPYKRARQTAEIAAEVLRYDKKIVQTEALLPEARPQALWEELRTRTPGKRRPGRRSRTDDEFLASPVCWDARRYRWT